MAELSEAVRAGRRPEARIDSITVAQEQRVEILKALYRGAGHPDPGRADRGADAAGGRELFAIIESLRAEGRSIIFISHKLNEVLEIADRITVLRRGKKVGTIPREARPRPGSRASMVGREVLLRVEKPAGGSRASRCWRSRTCGCSTTAACKRCAGSR